MIERTQNNRKKSRAKQRQDAQAMRLKMAMETMRKSPGSKENIRLGGITSYGDNPAAKVQEIDPRRSERSSQRSSHVRNNPGEWVIERQLA